MSPALFEMMASVVVSALGSSVVAPLASSLKRWVSSSERTVDLKLPSGRVVRLELDKRLSQEKVSELVTAAVQSAKEGNEAAVRQTIQASHVESRKAREVISG